MFEQTELHICKDCNCLLEIGDGDNEVRYGEDPYALEMHGDTTEHWMCGSCWDSSWERIE